MDRERVTALLDSAGFAGSTATPITGGWASWTFDVDGEYILRIARTDEIADTHRREARLLPELARTVDFAVPVPRKLSEFDGHTYMVYPRIPGRGLRPGDRVDAVAGMLRRLHDFPVARAAELLGDSPDPLDWQRDHDRMWTWVEADVLPRLDARARDEVRRRYEDIQPDLAAITPRLVHRDLGAEHILCAPDTGEPTAIIDFETATIGDPDIDFVGLLITLGAAETERLIARYGGGVSWRRLRFYWWMGAVHAVHYGVAESDQAIVDDGAAGLRRRLSELEEIEAAGAAQDRSSACSRSRHRSVPSSSPTDSRSN